MSLYKNYPNKYEKVFSIFHQDLNQLFYFLNTKIDLNGHFNASESRELLNKIEQMLEAIEKHPSDAIGKSKELIESCCKSIYFTISLYCAIIGGMLALHSFSAGYLASWSSWKQSFWQVIFPS